jgi:hypothetical protein
MDSRTRKRRGKWICKGLHSESTDRNGVRHYVMNECDFRNDYDVNANKLHLLNQRIRFNPTVGSPRTNTQRRHQPTRLSPRYERPSPSKLLERKRHLNRVTPKSRPKFREEIVITPKDKDPKWLYANYTGMIKDYDGNDVYVIMYSETRD